MYQSVWKCVNGYWSSLVQIALIVVKELSEYTGNCQSGIEFFVAHQGLPVCTN